MSRRLADTPPRPSSFTLPPVSVTKDSGLGRPQVERSKIQAGPSSGYPVSWASIAPGSGKSFMPSIQGPGDNSTCMPNILPNFSVVHSSVPVHGVTQLCFRSAPKAIITTFSFFRSDKPVYTTALLRPITPCQPTQAMGAPVFCYLWNPSSDLSRLSSRFLRMPLARAGAPIWGIPDFRYLEPFSPQAPHQQFGAQGDNFGHPSLGFSFRGPPSYDRYRQHYSSVLHQQTGRDPFPHPVTARSGSVPMATNIAIRARHILGCLNVIAVRLSRPQQQSGVFTPK